MKRTFYSGHDFKILQVDEAGNVFLWYTAISAGAAGKVIPARKSICTIIPLNTVEELAFIPSAKSPEIFEAELERLAYINGKNELYLLMNNQD